MVVCLLKKKKTMACWECLQKRTCKLTPAGISMYIDTQYTYSFWKAFGVDDKSSMTFVHLERPKEDFTLKNDQFSLKFQSYGFSMAPTLSQRTLYDPVIS